MNGISEGHLDNKATTKWIVATVTLLSIWAGFYYPGMIALFATYCTLSIAIIYATITNRPKSYFIFFLFSFLTLGCWAKITLHLLIGNNFIEPIGSFDESPTAWDNAIVVLITAFSALLICYFIVVAGLKKRKELETNINTKFLSTLLAMAIIFAIASLIFNYHHSIIKVGYEPTLKLHSYIYAVFSFMVAWGNAIAIFTLAYWLVKSEKLTPNMLFYIIIIEGALTSISMGSRAQMILHVSVPFIAYLIQGRKLEWNISKISWIKIFSTTALLFAFSIISVSVDRLSSFAKAVPYTEKTIEAENLEKSGNSSTSATGNLELSGSNSTSLELSEKALTHDVTPEPYVAPHPLSLELKVKLIAIEMSKLIVDRWIGAEGVLAVTSVHRLDLDLFLRGLKEDPAQGTQAIYQRISNAKYERLENFTFMTIPGPIAVLYYSGNYLTLFAGMALLFFLGYTIELSAKRLLNNIMTSATIGVAMAYLIVQINFPRAFLFFVIEITAFLMGLIVLRWMLNKQKQPSTPHINSHSNYPE
ncbi:MULTISPECIES: hypothetical protein [unclassified Pseudomonas]|uniref:hypothetical protein n=1 Tax=unclassified Pseudomonas TaxID=196821 RepID=UPI001CBE1537|nr:MULTISPECIES: hypothetical protein [unclassified Pseudomonas]